MASTPTFSVSKPNFPLILSSSRSTVLSPLQFPFPYLEFHNHFHNNSVSSISSPVKQRNKHRHLRPTKVSAATEEEETLVPEEETSPAPAGDSSDQTVSVPVSPSDVLTMIFQADGTLSDAAIPAVTKALEEVEGVSDLKVQVLEGIASVELTKQTTVQATGVASNLVEIIQGSGFKLQTLNLSFQDEEDFS